MALVKKELLPGEPGYFDKNENRYRYCNHFHDEGFRCTRPTGHKGPHAAHTVRGSEVGLVKLSAPGEEPERWGTPEGKKTEVNVQLATW